MGAAQSCPPGYDPFPFGGCAKVASETPATCPTGSAFGVVAGATMNGQPVRGCVNSSGEQVGQALCPTGATLYQPETGGDQTCQVLEFATGTGTSGTGTSGTGTTGATAGTGATGRTGATGGTGPAGVSSSSQTGAAPATAAATGATGTKEEVVVGPDLYKWFVGGFLVLLSLIVLVATGSVLSVLVLFALIALLVSSLVYYGFLDISDYVESKAKAVLPTPLAPAKGSPMVGSEVFHIDAADVDGTGFTYDEAAAVCAAFDSELATLEQVMEAYSKGAEWCNYGWTTGGMALYPTQKATWEALQKELDLERRTRCGRPGVNGGYMNPTLKLGVNCYGFKPKGDFKPPAPIPGGDPKKFGEMVNRFKDMMNRLMLAPFSRFRWSGVRATESFTGQESYGTQFRQTFVTPQGVIVEHLETDPYVESIATSGGYGGAPYGLRGDTGATGSTGMRGIQGVQGAQGPSGPRGEQGTRGERGERGEASTVPGPTGPTGRLGPTGAGTTGPTGRRGADGDPGPTGPSGPKGNQGDQGVTGPTGRTGPQGIQGIQGIQGVSPTDAWSPLLTDTYQQRDVVNGGWAGGYRGNRFDIRCPAGTVMIGVKGHEDGDIYGMHPLCA
jgi:hypothetical protein